MARVLWILERANVTRPSPATAKIDDRDIAATTCRGCGREAERRHALRRKSREWLVAFVNHQLCARLVDDIRKTASKAQLPSEDGDLAGECRRRHLRARLLTRLPAAIACLEACRRHGKIEERR